MALAMVFPGQGSQAVGMGVELAARWPAAARRYEEASAILGYDLQELCAQGPKERLSETDVAQPALYVAGFATWEVLSAEGLEPSFVAGHSLGEYTACAAAQVFSFADGLRAVRARGEASAEAAKRHPGGMLAVMGAGARDVDAWVAEGAAHGPVLVANRNAPDQVVVSGALPALDTVERLGKAARVRVIRLKVSGAFHSPLMQEAAEAMRQVLAGLNLADPKYPVVGNGMALPLTSARQIREELEAQLTSSVQWDACVRLLCRSGVTRIVECGPGRVLSGLIRKIDRAVQTFSTGSAKEIGETLAEIKGVASGTA